MIRFKNEKKNVYIYEKLNTSDGNWRTRDFTVFFG